MSIKKGWLQIRLCSFSVIVWPVSCVQHLSFSGAMACEGFRKRIILLSSSFECSGYLQPMLEGTGWALLYNQDRNSTTVFTEDTIQVTSGAVFICSGKSGGLVVLLSSSKTLGLRGHFGSSVFWSGGRAHASLSGLERQMPRSSWPWPYCAWWGQSVSGIAVLNFQDPAG